LEDRPALAYLLTALGIAAQDEGDHEQVEVLLSESLSLHRDLGDDRGVGICLSIMGVAALERGDPERAALHEEELLRWARETQEKVAIVYGLMVMAGVAVSRGEPPARAARLWGAEEALRQAIGFPVSPYDRAHYDYEGYQSDARTLLSDEASWEAAWSEGRAMTPEQAIEYALSEEEEKEAPAPSQNETAGPLSAREVEVLGLVAQGLTDAQVADTLHLSPRTVGQHLRSTYNKLGVPSRAAAVKEALARGLI
jgi:DNA-binding CsgD family transcriptional regulator